METLTWEVLERHLNKTAPALVSMGGTRDVRIGFEPAKGRLFIRAPLKKGAAVPPSQFAEITLEARLVDKHPVLEASTVASHLYREFHRLASLFAEECERPGVDCVDAFQTVAGRWRELITARSMLSVEEQTGLIGELAVLEALLTRLGHRAVESWTARAADLPDRHDFRIEKLDLEVKTTSNPRRLHVIHGLRQFAPSAGHRLYLISIRIERAGLGSGRSLPDRVRRIREQLHAEHQSGKIFEKLLEAAGYRDSDVALYSEQYVMADAPVVIPVDEHCPRLTPDIVSRALGPALSARLSSDVNYRVNVDGLGRQLAAATGLAALDQLRVE